MPIVTRNRQLNNFIVRHLSVTLHTQNRCRIETKLNCLF